MLALAKKTTPSVYAQSQSESAESEWMQCEAFASIAGVTERHSRRILASCASGEKWKGVSLVVRYKGKALQVYAPSLPEDLRDIWCKRYQVVSVTQNAPRATLSSNGKYSRRLAEDYALERWRVSLVSPALEYPKGSSERAEALRRIAGREVVKPNGKPWTPSISTLSGWINAIESAGEKALRRKPRTENLPRVFISRAWDKACPLSDEKKAAIAEHMATHVKSLWAKGAPGWNRVSQLASVELLDQCRAAGWADALLDQCQTGRSFVEKFRDFSLVALKEKNAKGFFDTQTPRIQRSRNGYKPGDIVVGDVHPMDVVREIDGRMVHARLISWLDVATYDIYVTVVFLPPNRGIRREDVIQSFADMVQAWGLPKRLMLDNGPEYKDPDMVRGFETLAALVSNFQDFSVGIMGDGEVSKYIDPEQFTAISRARPYNAPAKQIEHVFAIVEYQFFAMMPGWIGGDRMNKRTQNVGRDPVAYTGSDDDFARDIGICLDLYRNTPQKDGSSPNDKRRRAIAEGWEAVGISRGDMVFAFSGTKTAKVRTGGIMLEFGNEKNWYRADFIIPMIGKTVEIRYARWAREAIFCLDADGEFRAVPLASYFAQEDGEGAKEQSRLNAIKLRHIRGLKDQTKDVDILVEAARVNAALPSPPEIPFGQTITTASGKAVTQALESMVEPCTIRPLLPGQIQTKEGEIVDLVPAQPKESKPAATGFDPFDF